MSLSRVGGKINAMPKNQTKKGLFQAFLESPAREARKQGRGGNSLPLQPFSFPPRPSGLGFCETPQAFRSKKVRTLFSIGHQTGFCKFLEADREVCSPRLRARFAKNEAVKSNGGTKSQETNFSEMRRFVKTKFCMKIFEKMNVQKLSFPIFHRAFRLWRNRGDFPISRQTLLLTHAKIHEHNATTNKIFSLHQEKHRRGRPPSFKFGSAITRGERICRARKSGNYRNIY